MTVRNFPVRLAVDNADRFKADLHQAGRAGQEAMQRLERSTEPANRGLRLLNTTTGEVRRGLDGLASRAGPMSRLAGVLGPAGLIGGAAVGGLVALGAAARRAADEIASIGDAADRARIDVDLFEQLRAVLTLEGQPADNLEQAMATLNRRIAEARAGVGDASSTFQRLGVTLTDASGRARDTADVLRDVAAGLQGLSSESDRALVGQKLFAQTGRGLVAVLSEGAEALDRNTAKARELGMLYGGDLIRRSQEVNAQFAAQSQIVGVQLRSAFVEAAPAVQELTSAFVSALPRIIEFIQRVGQALGLLSAPISVQLAGEQAELERALRRRMNTAQYRWNGMDAVRDYVNVRPRTMAEIIDPDVIENTPRLRAMREEIAALAERQRRMQETIRAGRTPRPVPDIVADMREDAPAERGRAAGGGGRSGGAGAARAVREERDAYAALVEAHDARVRALEREAAAVGRTSAEIAQMEERNRLLDQVLRDGIAISAVQVQQIEGMAEAYAAAAARTDELKRAQEQAEFTAKTMQETFRDMTLAGRSFEDSVSGGLKRLGERLFDLATDPVFDLLAQRLAGIGGPQGILGGLGTAIGGAFTGAIGRRARGGPVRRGRPYWVGDGGEPELFVPDRPGMVVPASRMGGGPVFNISVTVTGGDGGREDGEAIARAIAAALPAAVDGRLGHHMRPGGLLATPARV